MASAGDVFFCSLYSERQQLNLIPRKLIFNFDLFTLAVFTLEDGQLI